MTRRRDAHPGAMGPPLPSGSPKGKEDTDVDAT
jgi:hypothetical protein